MRLHPLQTHSPPWVSYNVPLQQHLHVLFRLQHQDCMCLNQKNISTTCLIPGYLLRILVEDVRWRILKAPLTFKALHGLEIKNWKLTSSASLTHDWMHHCTLWCQLLKPLTLCGPLRAASILSLLTVIYCLLWFILIICNWWSVSPEFDHYASLGPCVVSLEVLFVLCTCPCFDCGPSWLNKGSNQINKFFLCSFIV